MIERELVVVGGTGKRASVVEVSGEERGRRKQVAGRAAVGREELKREVEKE